MAQLLSLAASPRKCAGSFDVGSSTGVWDWGTLVARVPGDAKVYVVAALLGLVAVAGVRVSAPLAAAQSE